jgi:D-alanyl-D-alanine carboxypeptidase
MRAVLEQFLQDNPGVPGIVAHRIAADGSPAGQAAGIADPRTGRPLTPDATFRLASNTKTFAAATALRMVERGRLALDAPIAGFLPGELVERLLVIDGTSHGAQVTVRHLLTHCSGVPSLEDAGFIRRLIAEPDHVWTPWEKVNASLAARPTGLPGEVVIYSDTGYVLLALVLEQAGGQPLAALYRELLQFGALGLRTIYLEKLEPVPAGSGPRLRHYVNGADVSDIDATCDLWGGGGLVCDARDLAGFWRALFGGQVFDRAGTLAEMCVTRPEPSAGRQLGMGVFRGEAAGGEMWFHTGAWGSFAVYHPATKVTVAGAMTESRNVDRSLVTRLYQRLLDELPGDTSGCSTNPTNPRSVLVQRSFAFRLHRFRYRRLGALVRNDPRP